MRKILLVIVVLFITAQVYAATVTLEVSDVGDSWASIRYSADANVSAFGLKVTADSGAIFTEIKDYNVGECTASVQGYGIFPGTIDINEDTGVVEANGTPLAPNWDPCDHVGPTGIGENTLIFEMGALYVEGNEPALSGTLVKVKVDGSCNVCVEGEPIRGNIVMTDGTAVEANDCAYILVGCPVPNVLAMDETDATTAIEVDHAVGNKTYECDEVEAAGEVLSQDPAGGIVVVCGSDVNLVISLGGPPVVPPVVGMTEAAAIVAIDAVDFISAGTVTYNWHLTATIGEVLNQNPGSGPAPCGTIVDILVVNSNTRPDNPVPDDGNHPQQHGDADTYTDYGWDPNSGSGGWGKPYHCVCDAAGDDSGMPFKYRVYHSDLVIFIDNWMKPMGSWPTGANPAADVDHKDSGMPFKYRVYHGDLNRLLCYWMKKDTDIGIPGPCPMSDAANNAWTCPW